MSLIIYELKGRRCIRGYTQFHVQQRPLAQKERKIYQNIPTKNNTPVCCIFGKQVKIDEKIISESGHTYAHSHVYFANNYLFIFLI